MSFWNNLLSNKSKFLKSLIINSKISLVFMALYLTPLLCQLVASTKKNL